MNKYSGQVLFYGQYVNFEIEDFYLTLYVPGEIAQKIMYTDDGNGSKSMGEKKPLEVNKLTCSTNDGFTNIDCFFDPLSYGSSSKTLFLGISTFKLPLKRYIVYDNTKKDDKYYMIYYSKNIHKLTNLIPKFQYDCEKNDNKYFIDFTFSSLNLISKFKIGSYEMEMKPTYKNTYNGLSMDFTPGLKLSFDKQIQDDDIEKFYVAFVRFIHYCSMRTNIAPDNFIISNGSSLGEIFSYFGINGADEEDLTSVWRDSFSWDILYKNAGTLFKLIYNNSIHILNNQEKRKLRIAVSFESISKDAAAFEYEFDSIYPDGIPHSEERKALEESVINELNPLLDMSTGKKKKIYKSLIKCVHMESLGDKIDYALCVYSKGLSTVRKRLQIELTNEEIAEYCRSIRNDVDHGNKISEVSNDIVLSYIILRCLIYAMQLRKANFDFDDIDVLTNLLYSIKGLPV